MTQAAARSDARRLLGLSTLGLALAGVYAVRKREERGAHRAATFGPNPPVESLAAGAVGGRWNEIGCVRAPIQRHWVDTTLTIAPSSPERADVDIEARLLLRWGPPIRLRGQATRHPEAGPGVWRVRWPLFLGLEHDAWVLRYDSAEPSGREEVLVVGDGLRRLHCWVFARSPSVSPETLASVTDDLRARGYDIAPEFVLTPRSDAAR